MPATMGEIEKEIVRPQVTDAKGILKQNREFLDFFWDIANPAQEIRLKAIEGIVHYLKKSEKPDEFTYAVKRLVDGLAHTREVARPGFSLALGQVLTTFEEVPLRTIFDQIKQKHNLQIANKKFIRNAAFGNFFGVLALSQSNRLSKEPQVVLECVQLLQSLSQHTEHLRDLPGKTMVDILSETPQEVFEEVLLGALQSDLSSAFSTPEQLQLLLVAMQKFPEVLKPKKLKKLLGTTTIVTTANVTKLTEVLKMAARTMMKDNLLPSVVLDLLQVSLKEDNFDLFWDEIIIKGMMKDQPGQTQYLGYRLLGAALPLLSLPQLKKVLSGQVMKRYGEHVVSVQLQCRFKFGPVMEAYVGDFFQGCDDSDKQLAVMQGFSLLTNQGYPVVASGWRVVQHLHPSALRSYIDWLKNMFLQPQLETCVDFVTRKQKEKQEEAPKTNENFIIRLRKWIIPRLTSIIENNQVKRNEELVMDVARFVFFHAFFNTKKSIPNIPETQSLLSVPLDDKSRSILVNSFFSLLQHMNNMPVLGESPEGEGSSQKRIQGVTADGTMWIYHVVQFADSLLNQPKNVTSNQPFSPDQRKSWNSMLSSVATLMKKAKKTPSPETNAFLQLFLLVGIHLFKAPEDLVDLMKDLQNCMEKAQEKKAKKKMKQPAEEEPHWAEVVVDILLSLLAQPSRHIRQVCKTVFAHICPHVTARALTAILDVLDPDKDEEESAIAVTDDKDPEDKTKKGKAKQEEDQEEDMEEDEDSGSDDDSDDETMEEGGEVVDQNFRLELMKVLQSKNALATEEDGSDAEELDDEAMMKLDGSIAALFLEQKKKMQAKKNEKAQMKKEKSLIRNFKIKVLDLIEVFLAKQPNSPLVLGLVEPLLTVIETSMSSESTQQEQDFLRRAADIFRNQLCRAKLFCKTVGDRQGELHDLLERLMDKAQKQTDSSVSPYFFSASLYLVKVLRGGAPAVKGKANKKTNDAAAVEELKFMGNVDVDRVTTIFKEALCSFMTKRNSPLPGQMFIDLFTRFPVLCVNLLDTSVEHITSGVREHQQSQACCMVLKGLQTREVQRLLAGKPWVDICTKAVEKLASTLEPVVESQKRVVQEKVVKAIELCLFLVKNIQNQKLMVSLDGLQMVLESMTEMMSVRKTGQLEDTYWAVMKHFGKLKPKMEKKVVASDEQDPPNAVKKKGFLPETKKRKNRKKQLPVSEKGVTATALSLGEGQGQKKKNRKKRKQSGEAPSQPSPSKKPKTQAQGMAPPKKSKKQGGESLSQPSTAKKPKTMPPGMTPKKKSKKQGGD